MTMLYENGHDDDVDEDVYDDDPDDDDDDDVVMMTMMIQMTAMKTRAHRKRFQSKENCEPANLTHRWRRVRNRTQATLVESDSSKHCAKPFPLPLKNKPILLFQGTIRYKKFHTLLPPQ